MRGHAAGPAGVPVHLQVVSPDVREHRHFNGQRTNGRGRLEVARWLAVPCRKLFSAKPMPELQVPVLRRPAELTSITY